MRRLAALPLFALFGCSHLQLGPAGGVVDLGAPRDTTIGVYFSPPRDVTLEEEPARENQAPEAAPDTAAPAAQEKASAES
ncbi:hypothetical protein [Myxococcus sp. Y35]|uniref:hypothetical protein n=1 Tax=Pseudomyxococcus flavus TaxID=3115648 RepID=UPI003CF5CB26